MEVGNAPPENILLEKDRIIEKIARAETVGWMSITTGSIPDNLPLTFRFLYGVISADAAVYFWPAVLFFGIPEFRTICSGYRVFVLPASPFNEISARSNY